MGMREYGSMATMVMSDKDLRWNVPEHWTLEEAATVPVVYGTVSWHRDPQAWKYGVHILSFK
jgi:NADPH:quinone reductase-like Zn-dependent oxidoreductase